LLFLLFYQPWVGDGDARDMAESAIRMMCAGMGPACLVGVPIALMLLRAAATSALAWGMAGAATALISVAIVGSWYLGLAFPMILFTFFGGMFVPICLAGGMLGALSGLIARLLLAVFLGMSGH